MSDPSRGDLFAAGIFGDVCYGGYFNPFYFGQTGPWTLGPTLTSPDIGVDTRYRMLRQISQLWTK